MNNHLKTTEATKTLGVSKDPWNVTSWVKKSSKLILQLFFFFFLVRVLGSEKMYRRFWETGLLAVGEGIYKQEMGQGEGNTCRAGFHLWMSGQTHERIILVILHFILYRTSFLSLPTEKVLAMKVSIKPGALLAPRSCFLNTILY